MSTQMDFVNVCPSCKCPNLTIDDHRAKEVWWRCFECGESTRSLLTIVMPKQGGKPIPNSRKRNTFWEDKDRYRYSEDWAECLGSTTFDQLIMRMKI